MRAEGFAFPFFQMPVVTDKRDAGARVSKGPPTILNNFFDASIVFPLYGLHNLGFLRERHATCEAASRSRNTLGPDVGRVTFIL
jgi:hypothetical protein